MYAYLGVTCRLHFWQNDWGLLCAAVIRHDGKDAELWSAQRVHSGEENASAAPAGLELATFQSQVQHFTHKLSQLLQHICTLVKRWISIKIWVYQIGQKMGEHEVSVYQIMQAMSYRRVKSHYS